MKKEGNSTLCPVCESETQMHLELRGYNIRSCASCTHQFADVHLTENHTDEQYGDDYFSGGGTSGYEDYVASKLLIRDRGIRYAHLLDLHWPEGRKPGQRRLLDVGCAAGFLMQGFKQSGWEVCGIDPNASMVAHARESGLSAHQGTLETHAGNSIALQNDQQYDLVTLVQVVAHLTDLQRAKTALAALVQEQGCVLIETWNCTSLTARLLRANWHEYSPPNVLHYFSKDSLDRYMAGAGFSVVAGGRPSKKITVGHGRSIFSYKYGTTSLGKAILSMTRFLEDDLSVPYPAEDLFWRLYQKR